MEVSLWLGLIRERESDYFISEEDESDDGELEFDVILLRFRMWSVINISLWFVKDKEDGFK